LFVPCVCSPSVEASFGQPLDVCSFLFFSFFLLFSQAITAENGAFGAANEEEVEGVSFVFH